jgi:uncharacterized protein YgbK (DUF1537 family)
MGKSTTKPVQIVVLDDDPTGIQTVHSCYMLTQWDADILRDAFADSHRFFYILTNTRAYEPEMVRRIIHTAVRNVMLVNQEFGYEILFISRSDSTLRSHFPLEVDTIAETARQEIGRSFDAVFLVPSFFEAGRFTREDTHYLIVNGRSVPTSETEFARDSVFGYSSSHLPEYIEEKTGGRIRADQVRSLSLDFLRKSNTGEMVEFFQKLDDRSYVVVNAESYDDLYRFSRSLLASVSRGKHFLLQSAASLVKALSDIPDRPLLGPNIRNLPGPGIVVVGSYVQTATDQLNVLISHPNTRPHQLDATAIIKSPQEELGRIQPFLRHCRENGKTPVVYTPRQELLFPSKADRLQAGLKISSFLARLLKELPYLPSFVISKGGITSHVAMVEGMQVSKARVLGQILPGIPVIAVERGGQGKTIPFVICPGNVGDKRLLLSIFSTLDTTA